MTEEIKNSIKGLEYKIKFLVERKKQKTGKKTQEN